MHGEGQGRGGDGCEEGAGGEGRDKGSRAGEERGGGLG